MSVKYTCGRWYTFGFNIRGFNHWKFKMVSENIENGTSSFLSIFKYIKMKERNIVIHLATRNGNTKETRVYCASPRGLFTKNKPLTPKSLENPLVFEFIDNNCGGNVIMNRRAFEELVGKSLSIVVGAYGLCKGGSTDWYEWGSPGLSAAEMITCPLTGGKNCHLWLEDGEGNVYDYVSDYISKVVAPIHKKTIETSEFLANILIVGQPKRVLKVAGLKYIPAPVEEQEKVLEHTLKNLQIRVKK